MKYICLLISTRTISPVYGLERTGTEAHSCAEDMNHAYISTHESFINEYNMQLFTLYLISVFSVSMINDYYPKTLYYVA